jgi:hypothetical protein
MSAAPWRGEPIWFAWFPTGMPHGPALGVPASVSWSQLVPRCRQRREGIKDGPNVVPARFRLELDGRHVRRLGANLEARTAIVLDCETNKATGEVPPDPADAALRVQMSGWASVLWTTHNHTAAAPRFRIALPLSAEIDHQLPAVAVIADTLGLAGVIDRSKRGAASLFYLPSCAPGELDRHETIVTEGTRIDAGWITEVACNLLAERVAEQERIARAARAEAERRRQKKIAAGFDPDDSLIERIRSHLDLEQVLLAHGYDKQGNKFRHSNSQSGSFGADIKAFGSIERVYSHNAGDPLHRDNLPAWCTVSAIDAVDAAIILDHGGDRTRGLRELAQRFGLADETPGPPQVVSLRDPAAMRRYAAGALRHASRRVAFGDVRTLRRELSALAGFTRIGVLTTEEVADALALAAVQAGLAEHEVVPAIDAALGVECVA